MTGSLLPSKRFQAALPIMKLSVFAGRRNDAAFRVVVVVVTLLWSTVDVSAYSTGAGSCTGIVDSLLAGGYGAVGGPHLDQSKTVEAVQPNVANLQIQVGGAKPSRDAPFPITAGQEYPLSFKSPVVPYRGILIRIAPFTEPGKPAQFGVSTDAAFFWTTSWKQCDLEVQRKNKLTHIHFFFFNL
jgi:hypothetical protein